MKKILVAFDGSLYSESALDYAIALTQNEPDNLIVGVFIEDLSYIYMVSNFGVEPTSYDISTEALERMKQNEEMEIKGNQQKFQKKCEKANVNYNVHLNEGVTIAELIRESTYADLMIIGYRTYFSNTGQSSSQKVLKEFLTDSYCPILVVPENYQPINRVIFTYDGNPDSVYSIRHFKYTLNHNFKDCHHQLLTVLGDEEEEVENEDLLKEYLSLHFSEIAYEQKLGKPEEEIPNHLEASSDSLLVMGVYNRNALMRLFVSSVTDDILKAQTTPVFIAHR